MDLFRLCSLLLPHTARAMFLHKGSLYNGARFVIGGAQSLVVVRGGGTNVNFLKLIKNGNE